MKVFAILAAVAVAAVSAQTPDCDPALVAAVRSTDGTTCTSETGYSATSFTVPTGADLVKVCSNPSCKALLAAVNKAVPTECSFGGIMVKAVVVDPITKACAGVASTPTTAPATTTAAPATTKPATTTAAPGATTAAPSATTAAPSATTAAPSTTTEAPAATTEAPAEETASGSGSGGEEIESPSSPAVTKAASNATTPTPAPTSGASAVVAAAGAVVFAVAASMF